MPSVGPALVQILIAVGVVALIFSAGTVFFRFPAWVDQVTSTPWARARPPRPSVQPWPRARSFQAGRPFTVWR